MGLPGLDPTPRRGLWAALAGTTFRSLRHRDYRLYFLGQIVSFTGSWAQSAALMWLVYDRTADPLWPPLLIVAQVGPTLVLGPLGGVLADKVPRKRLVLITQALFAVSATLLTLLVATNAATVEVLLGLQILSGAVQGVDLPARLAFVPELVPKEDLINAIALNSTLFNSARLIGPALAGGIFVLVGGVADPARVGAAVCFAVNAVSYAAVLFALVKITAGTGPPHHADAPPGTAWDGVRFLLTHAAFGQLVVFTGFIASFAWPVVSLLPAYTATVLGLRQEAYSFLVSALGGGALVGALATATFGTVGRRDVFLVLGPVVGTIGLFTLATVHTPAAAGAACAACGFGLIIYLSTAQSALQLHSPDAVRGRVMALWAMTLSASAPFGHLVAGFAARQFGVADVLVALAIGVAVSLVGVAVLVLGAGWRGMASPASSHRSLITKG
jgi:MFS family permease